MRPAWTWMPTLKGPLRVFWPLYRRWSWWREGRGPWLCRDRRCYYQPTAHYHTYRTTFPWRVARRLRR